MPLLAVLCLSREAESDPELTVVTGRHRPKAASEIEDIGHASRLLGHSSQEMTKKVYRLIGEILRRTK